MQRSNLRKAFGQRVQDVLDGKITPPGEVVIPPPAAPKPRPMPKQQIKRSGTGCRYVVMPLAEYLCLIDLCPDDEDYIVRSSRGATDYIQKEIYSVPSRSPEAAELPAIAARMNAPYRDCRTFEELEQRARKKPRRAA